MLKFYRKMIWWILGIVLFVAISGCASSNTGKDSSVKSYEEGQTQEEYKVPDPYY